MNPGNPVRRLVVGGGAAIAEIYSRDCSASYSSCRRHHSYREVCGVPRGESSQSSWRPRGVRSRKVDPEIVDGPGGVKQLAFSNAWGNAGEGPWETAPIGPASSDDCDADGNASNDVVVVQRVYGDANHNGVFERGTDTGTTIHPAGCMVFHPAHNHFHVEDVGLYSLLAEPTGTPVGASRKVSFCLLDIYAFDLTLPGAPQSPYYSSCNPEVQGISVGWYDEYSRFLAGQEIDLDGVVAGNYCLRSQFDPENRFLETNETNNPAEQRYFIDPGAEQVTPLSGACIVDGAPQTAISSGPADGSVIADTTPSFAFASNYPASTFECRVDSEEFAPCVSPHTTATLNLGTHVFAVRAIGPAGFDETPATRSFTIEAPPPEQDTTPRVQDTTAPKTQITSGPAGKTHNRTPRFRFQASEPSTFECKLNRRSWAACTSPRTYGQLRPGRHRFKVRATDPAGNTEPEPASQRFRITARS